MVQRTLTIIKPDAVRAKVQGHIIQRILDEGFQIVAMRQLLLARADAENFYAVHRERPFYKELVGFMTSGPVIVACLEREDAVAHLRQIMGPTDSRKAPKDTIRGLFGTDIQNNAIHGSDSPENAANEIAFFFTSAELGAANKDAAPEGSNATPVAPSTLRPPRLKER
jgi:nucleoside-diphosphate kinase